MSGRRTFLALLAALLLAPAAWAQVGKAAPPGYAWQDLPAIKSAVLVPKGWTFTELPATEGTSHYAISRDKPDATGKYRAGLGWKTVTEVPRRSGQPIRDFAGAFVLDAAAKHTLTLREPKKMGALETMRLKFEDAPPGKEALTVYHFLVANEKTGTFHILTFEAPSAEWEAAWRVANVIFNHLRLDDDF